MATTTDTASLLAKMIEQTKQFETVIIKDHEAQRLVAAFEAERQCRIAAEARVKELEAEGWERAAKWVDARREAYDREHGRYDNETGMTEFSNAASEEYSTELFDIAEGLRAGRKG